jgi:hypothetical protein
MKTTVLHAINNIIDNDLYNLVIKGRFTMRRNEDKPVDRFSIIINDN